MVANTAATPTENPIRGTDDVIMRSQECVPARWCAFVVVTVSLRLGTISRDQRCGGGRGWHSYHSLWPPMNEDAPTQVTWELASMPGGVTKVTVVHEIAHYFGIDERRIRRLGY